MENVIIIGSGPAGLSAGIYTGRAGLNPLIVEGPCPSGQLILASNVENYPGFPSGIPGYELMELMTKQAKGFGARFISGSVSRVDFNVVPFKIWISEKCHKTNAVIIATGARARRLGIPAEKKLLGFGVSFCATCDGRFFRDKGVVVVGGGDTAISEAIFLAALCKNVTVIHRRDKLRASMALQKVALKNPKISFIFSTILTDIFDVEMKKVVAVRLRNVKTNEEYDLPCDGVFVAIGYIPDVDIFKGQIQITGDGYISCHNGQETSTKGVFACGDCVDARYRQAITAAASGSMAGLDCIRYLEERK